MVLSFLAKYFVNMCDHVCNVKICSDFHIVFANVFLFDEFRSHKFMTHTYIHVLIALADLDKQYETHRDANNAVGYINGCIAISKSSNSN